MPVCCDPRKRLPLVLDADKDASPTPTFVFRYLSGRRFMELADMQEAALAANTTRDALAAIYNAIRVGLVGWHNVMDPDAAEPTPLAYDPARLEDVLSVSEAKELLDKLATSSRPSEDDQKKSE